MYRQDEDSGGRGWLAFVPAAALLIVSAAGLFVAKFSPSGDRGQYAVVAPVWYDMAQTIGLAVRAGGDVVDVGSLANVVIVHSESPKFVGALYHAGAWLVIDPVRLRGCLGFEQASPPPAAGDV
jgi:hypothetical protein